MTEDALDTFRSSTLGWLRGTLAGLGTALLFVLGIGLTIAGIGVAQTGITWLPLLLTVAAIVIIAVVAIGNLAASYQITDERLIIRTGIIFKAVDEIELYRIKNVRLDFTLLNQLANIGSICVSSSDETTRGEDLILPHIDHAERRREELRRLVDTARQRRRVREIDLMHEDY